MSCLTFLFYSKLSHISRSLGPARHRLRIVLSLWNLTDASAAFTKFIDKFQSDIIILTSDGYFDVNNGYYLVVWTLSLVPYLHYSAVIMGVMASQITSLTIVNSTVYSDTDQIKIKSLRHWPLYGEFTGNAENGSIVLFDDVIMLWYWD